MQNTTPERARALCSSQGIFRADVILVPLEDGIDARPCIDGEGSYCSRFESAFENFNYSLCHDCR